METNHGRCMVLDDGTDGIICSTFQSVGAERIPMKIIENLSDIWVPSYLLKRENFPSKNLNKPAIFHKLERNSENSFSVYIENVDPVENFFVDTIAQEDMLDLLNNYTSLEANSCPGYDEVSPIEASENSEINDCEILINSNERESLSPECLEKNSESATICDKEIYDYVKSACLKTSIKTNYKNVNTSLDDIYNSDDEINKEVKRVMSKDVSIEKCDSLVTPLNISEAEASASLEQNLESNAEKGACLNPHFEGNLESERSGMNYYDDSEVDVALVNFPIAYKRPTIKETVKKQKNQKKKKNAQKKVVLDVFTESNSDYSYCEVDKFYESVMKKNWEYEKPYEHEYPSLKTELEDINKNHYQNFDTVEEASQFEEFRETDNTNSLIEGESSTSASVSDSTNSCLETAGVIIVMENLPKYVLKDQVQDLLTNGEVRSLCLSKCGRFKNAEIRMNSDADAEWIIDCYNGVAPFGVGSSILKCYKLF